MKYRDLVQRFANEPMAMLPERLSRMQAMILSHGPDEDVDESELRATLAASVRANPRAPGSIAVVPLIGSIQQREDMWTRYGFATSSEAFVRNMQQAAADPNIKAIIVDVDSPGGDSVGTPEAGDAIFALRGVKPMVGVSNGLNASAAYWIASALDEVVGSPSSYTGSIGCWTLLVDQSEYFAAQGIKVTMVKAGKYKAIGNPWEPVTEEVLSRFQTTVDRVRIDFVKAVARNRGVPASAVDSGYGEGDVLDANAAKAAGLIDRVATMADTIARFGGSTAASTKAEDESPSFAARERERARLELAR